MKPYSEYAAERRTTIQTNLKELRREHGKTQTDIARLLGKSKTAVASWEQGLSLPDTAALCYLAEFYHVPMCDIVGETNNVRI